MKKKDEILTRYDKLLQQSLLFRIIQLTKEILLPMSCFHILKKTLNDYRNF